MLTSVKQVEKKPGVVSTLFTPVSLRMMEGQNKWGEVRRENERCHQHKRYCNLNLFSALELSPIPVAAASVSRLLMIKETAGRMELKVILNLYCSYVTMYMQARISETQNPL